MGSCRAALHDAFTPFSISLSLWDLSGNRTRDQVLQPAVLVAQLDRPQVAMVAALQLLHHSLDKKCGQLRLLHTDDWPELRLAHGPFAASNVDEVSTLPTLCNSSAHGLWRALDYRCHVPQTSSGTRFLSFLPPLFQICLRQLAGGAETADVRSEQIDQTIRLLGGVGTAATRRALTIRAALLVARGMDESLLEVSGVKPMPPCCAPSGCTPPGCGTSNSATPPIAPPPSSDVVRELSQLGDSIGRTPDASLPRHPLGIGPVAPERCGARGHVTRPPHALVASHARRHIADAEGLLPASFDQRYRNPCWRCKLSPAATARLCCLPYAHILGVSKCGTTDLYARLAIHPQVLPSDNKGPHFWDEPHAFTWYLGLFERSAAKLELEPASRSSILLDASSNTLTYAGIGIRGEPRPTPPLLLPQLMEWLQPDLKLLVMLREPSARYYSAYQYYNRRYHIYETYGPQGAVGFGRMAAAEVVLFDRCRVEHSARRCARQLFTQAQQLVKGLYAIFLRDWLCSFSPSQLLVLRMEDYAVSPAAHLRRVLSFLGLAPLSGQRWHQMLSRPRANAQRAAHGTASTLLPETISLLSAFYAPFNQELVSLMDGDIRFLWLDQAANRNLSAPRSLMME